MVFDVFKEVRRPQLPLVRDLVSAVLHPTLLAMPELNNGAVLPAVSGVGAEADADAAVEDDNADGARANSPQVKKERRLVYTIQ